MNETSKIVADTIRSMVRIGFLTFVLYVTAKEFDESEGKIIGAYAAAESGLRSFDWLKKKTDQE